MIAHVNPLLILGFLTCLILGNLSALISAIGTFASMRRHYWLLVVAWLAVAMGASATWVYVQDGGDWEWNWMLGLCVGPVVVGVTSLIRWKLLGA